MSTTYRVLDGDPLTVLHHGQGLTVSRGSPINVANPTQPPGQAPTQPRNRTPRHYHDKFT